MNSQRRNQMLGMATGMGQSRIESPGSFPQVLPTSVMMPNNQILPHAGNFNASSQLALAISTASNYAKWISPNGCSTNSQPSNPRD